MPNLQTQRTKKLIYMGLKELLLKEPFSKITVNEISDKALIHRSTFYTHFDDKFDLLSQFLASQRTESDLTFSEWQKHPYTSVATLNNEKLLPILRFQSNDPDFTEGFFQFIIDSVLLDSTADNELDRFFFIGRIKAINIWIIRTHQPYNPFVDYEYLDKVFLTGKK